MSFKPITPSKNPNRPLELLVEKEEIIIKENLENQPRDYDIHKFNNGTRKNIFKGIYHQPYFNNNKHTTKTHKNTMYLI